MNDQVGSGYADYCLGVSFECINEGLLEGLRGCCVKGKSCITRGVDQYVTGSFMAGYQVGSMFQIGGIVDVAQTGCCAGYGPFVFFSRS